MARRGHSIRGLERGVAAAVSIELHVRYCSSAMLPATYVLSTRGCPKLAART